MDIPVPNLLSTFHMLTIGTAPGLIVEHIQTTPGRNTSPLPHHVIGLHLGAAATIAHWREGVKTVHRFQPGDVVFTPAGEPVRYAHAEVVNALYINLAPGIIAEAADQLAIDLARHRLVDHFGRPDPVLAQLGRALLSEMRFPGVGSQLLYDSFRTQIVVHLLRSYTLAPAAAQPPEDDTAALQRRLRPALEYVHAHFAEDISLKALAETVHLTPAHFSRLFKRAYSTAPHQYVIQQRVEAARELLRDPALTVLDVALRVGFADHSHLLRHYKRLTGTTPRA
ncbi:MAG: AraC family transcriptional regulator [Chloroflexota bacterium]|nr:AraC family transcriptional regulator [Chloroflexota bacterium]